MGFVARVIVPTTPRPARSCGGRRVVPAPREPGPLRLHLGMGGLLEELAKVRPETSVARLGRVCIRLDLSGPAPAVPARAQASVSTAAGRRDRGEIVADAGGGAARAPEGRDVGQRTSPAPSPRSRRRIRRRSPAGTLWFGAGSSPTRASP